MTAVGIAGVAAVSGVANDPAIAVAMSLPGPDPARPGSGSHPTRPGSGSQPTRPGAPLRDGEGNVSLVVGTGPVLTARAELLAAVDAGLDDGVAMEQVHGGSVRVVGTADRGSGMREHATAVAAVDALVTFDTDVALLVQTADCVPVLLVDPGRAVAAVHAGRRGVLADVVGAAVAALDPPRPDAVAAVIGPAIGGCCYELPAAVAAEVRAAHPAAAARTRWGTPSADLPTAVGARLAGLGVRRIGRWGGCTACEPDRWFSHRAAPGLGRQGAVVVRRSERRLRSSTAAAPPSGGTGPFLHWQP